MIACSFSGDGVFDTVMDMISVLEREVQKEEIDSYAKEVLSLLKAAADDRAVVLALSGDLGAGKTTFVQALGRQLGVADDVTSPTFTIMKGYETTDETFANLVHMDAYRIDSEEELRPLRFGEILATPKTLVCVEWAERIKGALPTAALHLTLSPKDETTRTATITRL